VHLGIIAVNNKLDAHFLFLCVFMSILYMFRAAYIDIDDRLVSYIEWHIPDILLIQLILLMMGTWLPETC